jgi:hypothetical protein
VRCAALAGGRHEAVVSGIIREAALRS